MTYLQAIIMSMVEGLTEFLPVSSTAHLVMAAGILGVIEDDFAKSFEIIIQLGAILSVGVLYFKELVKDIRLWLKIILAFLPSAVLGLLFYDFIKYRLLGNGLVTSLALIIGGLVFMFIDKLIGHKVERQESQENIRTLSTIKLLAIGLCQSLAMIPGVSRAAASIAGGMLMGLNKRDAAKFSFFLAIPTMLAATTLDLYKSNFSFSGNQLILLSIGFVGSFITALFAVKTFIKFVQNHSFVPFGIYRIIVGFVWLWFVLNLTI